MNQREIQIKVHLIHFTAELGALMRDLAIHEQIEKENPLHSVKLWKSYRHTRNAVRSMRRELAKMLENEEWASIYFRSLLDGSICSDYSKIPYDRVIAKEEDYE